MAEKRTIILNSLLTLILIASIYQFYKSDHLSHDVGALDGRVQHAQQQIADLKEAASATFEQTMRRFDDFGRQLSGITGSKSSAAARVASAAPEPRSENAQTGARTTTRRSSAVARRNARTGQRLASACDLPCYRRMLLPMLSQVVESAGYRVVRDQGTPQTVQVSSDQAKLNKDLLDFLQMRARVCDIGSAGTATDDKIKRCNDNTRQLADQNNSAAQKWLGADAHDKQHDLQMAISWFEKAANQGDTEAMDYLGAIYSGAEGQVNQTVSDALVDPMKALSWYGKAAGLGDANAMAAIAGIYQEGRLIPQNQVEAVTWYEMAAKAEASLSKSRTPSGNFAGVLGDLYYKGDGVEQDKIKAYEWYAIACSDAGRLNAPRDSSCLSRNSLASELGAIDLAKAQALTAEWEKLHR